MLRRLHDQAVDLCDFVCNLWLVLALDNSILRYSGIEWRNCPLCSLGHRNEQLFATILGGSLMAKGNGLYMAGAVRFWARKVLLGW